MENKLIKGAKIATIGLLITKALGILYLIPMNALLSSEAMGIYGVSYAIYAFFIQVTLVGFPVGVSKMVAKYRTQNNFTMVGRTFKYSITLISAIAIVLFSTLFFATDLIVSLMDVGIYDANEVALTLKILAPSLLVIPALAITRGYVQGYEDMLPSSISIVIEQLVRIIIIVGGLIIAVVVLEEDDMVAIYIATIASFFSAFSGYLVIFPAFRKYSSFAKTSKVQSDIVIGFKKTIELVAIVSVPFIVLSTYKGAFELIDAFTINKILSTMDVTAEYITHTITAYTVQIQKLVILTLTIASGFTMSMIPSFSALHTSGNIKALRVKITQVTLLAFFVISFVSVFTAVFNSETYFVFFFTGEIELGSKIFTLSIVSSIFYAMYNVVGVTLLTINHVKPVVISFIAGMIMKIGFGYIFAFIFNKLGIEKALVFAAASFVGYATSFAVVLAFCIKKNYIILPRLIKCSIMIFISIVLVGISAFILSLLLPSISPTSSGVDSYGINIAVLMFAGAVCLTIYLLSAEKMNYLKKISGNSLKDLVMAVKKRATR